MKIPQEMLDTKQALAPILSTIPGIVGVDIGLREEDGYLTDELGIRIYVANPNDIPSQLQEIIKNTPYPVFLIYRNFRPLIDNAQYPTIVGGIEIAAIHRNPFLNEFYLHGAGTLGGIAQDLMFGGIVGVTCAHVIAASEYNCEIMQGDKITQPKNPNRPIGSLYRWSDMFDIAVFAFDSGILAQSKIEEIGFHSGMAEPEVGHTVFKRGRTTLLTTGRVGGKHLQIFGQNTLPYGFEVHCGPLISPQSIFCDYGDSGSLIIDDNNKVVGILSQMGVQSTWGTGTGSVSGFAMEIIPAASSVGIKF